MLSRVADSLYWMSRYFERADNASRVLEATYGLILNPAKFSTDERWFKAVTSLAPGSANVDPQGALFLLVADPEGAFSIVKCIGGARENARQVREEISSEMWEHLNRLFRVTGDVVFSWNKYAAQAPNRKDMVNSLNPFGPVVGVSA